MKGTEDVNMRRFSLRSAQWLRFVGPVAMLLLISLTPARTQTNNYEFNDSHFHLTNNIQEGPTIHDLGTYDFASDVARKTSGGTIHAFN